MALKRRRINLTTVVDLLRSDGWGVGIQEGRAVLARGGDLGVIHTLWVLNRSMQVAVPSGVGGDRGRGYRGGHYTTLGY